MKFKSIFIFLIFGRIVSTPLMNGVDGIVTPLLLDFNPSLISTLNGGVVGSSIQYDYYRKSVDLYAGYSERINNSGFSLVLKNLEKNSLTEIVSGFSTKKDNFNFGAAFKFIVNEGYIDFTVNSGANFNFSNDIYVGFLVSNIPFNYKFIDKYDPFEIDIVNGGKIPRIRKFRYDLKLKMFLLNKFSDLGYGGHLSINKYFLENPNVIIYLGIDYNNMLIDDYELLVDGSIGSKVWFKNFAFSYFLGSKVEMGSMHPIFYGELSFDTRHKSVIQKLSCKIKAIENKDDFIISSSGIFKTERSSLKRWTVFIYTKNFRNENIIKTFSGGNIPPSSIIWNKRDNSGKLVDKGDYFIKLVIIDNLNRTIQSNRETISINY